MAQSRTVSIPITLTGSTTTATLFLKRKPVSEDYTIVAGSDYLIACDTTNNSMTITLPAASSSKQDLGLGTTIASQIFVINDEAGNASTNNITIATTGDDTINGSSTKVMGTNHMSLQLYSNGTDGYHIM